MSDDDAPKLWERLPDEPTKAYHAFRVFRDLGVDRTLAKTGEELGLASRTLKGYSSKWRWVERATAWDDATTQLEDDTRLEAIRKMFDQHSRLAQVMIAKALAALQALPANHIPAGAAVRLLDLGTKIERQVLSTTPEAMLGEQTAAGVDPWEEIARELAGAG